MVHIDTPDGPTEATMDLGGLKAFMRERPTQIWLISPGIRPGIAIFTTYVEFKLYPPETEKNDSFELLDLAWQGLTWLVSGMPIRDLVQLKQIAPYCGMRIIDGVPVSITTIKGSLKRNVFPMNTARCFTLENTPDYNANGLNPGQQNLLAEMEQRMCKKIWEGWRPARTAIQTNLLKNLAYVRKRKGG